MQSHGHEIPSGRLRGVITLGVITLGVITLGACPSGGPSPGVSSRDAALSAPLAATPGPPEAGVAEVAIPDARRCGEAGAQPTALPPALVAGPAALGNLTLAPGERGDLGGIALHYDPKAWIGSRRSGHRGPALGITVDRAEIADENAAYGETVELTPGQRRRTSVGPFALEIAAAAAGGDGAPAEVAVTATRAGCPARGEIAASAGPGPQWLWVSSAGIPYHVAPRDDHLMLAVERVSPPAAGGDGESKNPKFHLRVASLGYYYYYSFNKWGLPTPEIPRQIAAGTHRITLDRVVDDDPAGQLHVRAAIEPWAASAVASKEATPRPCGGPGATPAPAPAAWEQALAPPERTLLGPGEELQLDPPKTGPEGPLFLRYVAPKPPPAGDRGDAPILPSLGPRLVLNNPRGGNTTVRADSLTIHRVGAELLRLSPAHERRGAVAVERFAVACPFELTLAPAPEPAAGAEHPPRYLWLSSLGHARIELPELAGVAPSAILGLTIDARESSLELSSGEAALQRPVSGLPGRSYSLPGRRVDILEVVSAEDPAGIPRVHVHLQITPVRAPAKSANSGD